MRTRLNPRRGSVALGLGRDGIVRYRSHIISPRALAWVASQFGGLETQAARPRANVVELGLLMKSKSESKRRPAIYWCRPPRLRLGEAKYPSVH
jgi:hypothetical protein